MAQILKPNRSDNRGGSRPNAGRPKGDKKSVSFRLNKEEEKKIRNYLKQIRTT